MRNTSVQFAFERLEIRALLSAGLLDSSFGEGGKVVAALSDVIGFEDVVALPDRSTIAAANSGVFADAKMRLARYDEGGALDTSFGEGGVASVDFGSDKLSVHRLLLQQDGKILAIGQKAASETSQFALTRLTPTGALDTSFGTGGLLVIDVGNDGGNDYASDALQLANGQILVAGSFNVSSTTVLRLNLNGTIDTTFGANGAAVAPVDMTLPRLALAPDGKIIAASTGHKDIKSGSNIVRFTAGGILDTGFSGDGIVFYENFFAGDVFVTPTNRTVSVGYDTGGNIIVRRLIPGGGGDTTLSPTGAVSYPSGADNVSIADIQVQSDGKTVFVGQLGNSGEATDFLVGRLNANLSLDTSFGTSGLTSTNIKGFDAATCVDIDALGKIIVGGNTFTTPESADEAGALVRFTNNEASATVVDRAWIINGTSENDAIFLGVNGNGDHVVSIRNDNQEDFEAQIAPESVDLIVISGGAGRDHISAGGAKLIINGNAGNDFIYAGDGDDLLIGGNGHDRLDGGHGADTLIGGGGRDTVTYENRTGNLTIGIGDIPGGSGEAGENDLISNSVERIRGGAGDDRIAGSSAANLLFGGLGNDTLVGFGGDDALYGEGGSDRLIGGVGADLIDGSGGIDRADLDFSGDSYMSIESFLE